MLARTDIGGSFFFNDAPHKGVVEKRRATCSLIIKQQSCHRSFTKRKLLHHNAGGKTHTCPEKLFD